MLSKVSAHLAWLTLTLRVSVLLSSSVANSAPTAFDPSSNFQTCLFQSELGFANHSAPFPLSHFDTYLLDKTIFAPFNFITVQSALMPSPQTFTVGAPSSIWAPAATYFSDAYLGMTAFVPKSFDQLHLIRYPLLPSQNRRPVEKLRDIFNLNRFGSAQLSLANQPSLLVWAHTIANPDTAAPTACADAATAKGTSKFVCYPVTRALSASPDEVKIRVSDEFTTDDTHSDSGDASVTVRNPVLFCAPASTQKTDGLCLSPAFESSLVCYRQNTKKLGEQVKRFVSDDFIAQYKPQRSISLSPGCNFTPVHVTPGDELVCLPGQAIQSYDAAKSGEKELAERGPLCP